MSIAYLGIGSNIGQRETNCEEAVSRLRASEGIRVRRRSQFYVTKPMGGPPQEDYLNGVLAVATDLPPDSLFNKLKTIEADMGRGIFAGRNYPRLIDIDILLYDDVTMETDKLVIPHPRMHERSFVLKGLFEIAPRLMHPVLNKSVKELYRGVSS